jgi:hypothetical protein
MQDQLQKAINLAKKTGDRLIVYDMSNGEDAYVVMGMDDYEKLVTGNVAVKDLTEDELLDKINRDIAVWKNEQNNKGEEAETEKKLEKRSSDADFVYSKYQGENSERFDEGESEVEEYKFPTTEKEESEEETEQKKNNNWGIPSERINAADEVIDEDTQYLEEVKF